MNDTTPNPPNLDPKQKARERLAKTPEGRALLAKLDQATKGKQDISKIHAPEIGPSPIRATIGGDMQTIAEAEAMIDGYADVPATLKQFLKDELAELGTNACELHLHLLDLANGDVTLAVHIKGVQMGPKVPVATKAA